ncbi:MAG: ABC transporter ATP-binding protein [Clostridiales bacterium]|nr:ABC transporter ATP-binding protein [Clostridiales bacterium]MBQ3019191.1 ABC transporter ATP-binding protein [Clostridia bacterium]
MAKTKTKTKPLSTIKPLLGSVREYKKPSLITPFFMAVEAFCECLIPFFAGLLISKINVTGIQADAAMRQILKYGGILLGLAILSLLSGGLAGKFAATASCGFAKNLRHDLFYKVQKFSFANVDKFSSSSLVTRLTTDVTNVQQSYQMCLRIVIRVPLQFLFAIIMSFITNAKLAWIFLAITPILGVLLVLIMLYVMPFFRKIFKKYDALNNSVQENVGGIRVVKSYVREDYETVKFKKAAGEVRDDFTKAEKILALNNPIMTFFINFACVVISVLASFAIVKADFWAATSNFEVGQLSTLISYGIQMLSCLMMFSMIFVMLSMSLESARRISEVLTTESDLTSPENGLKEVKDGSIRFENVNFKYAKTANKYALSDIDLDVASGETVGILGGTGSSKTTLIQLIPRLYDATDGAVYVGGVNVKEYDLDVLRQEVAVVLQKNVLFSGTIKENLRWGNAEASDEELVRVAKLAQAHSFIESFPDGYDTYIEAGGTNVSGGQKQRLCIARALLRKPKVLILDDSTSAVDTKTDALIRHAFKEEIPNTTKIIIAQRVSSVEHADKILILDGGKIVACGNHETLLKTSDIYREIYEAQTKSKAPEKEEGGDA